MSEILISDDAGLRCIRLNRPEKKNALTRAMYSAIAAALREAATAPGIRAILITGGDACFTSGNDVADFRARGEQQAEVPSPAREMLSALAECPKPVVAAVAGYAIGIGTTLLLHCDLTYCDSSARFQMPFVSLGLCPEAGSSFALPLMAGHRRAAELLLLGEAFNAETAREIGLVNAVVRDESVITYALKKATQLTNQPYASVILTKSLLKQSGHDAFSTHMRLEGQHFMARVTSPEAIEAFSAFQEKRQPNFRPFDPLETR